MIGRNDCFRLGQSQMRCAVSRMSAVRSRSTHESNPRPTYTHSRPIKRQTSSRTLRPFRRAEQVSKLRLGAVELIGVGAASSWAAP